MFEIISRTFEQLTWEHHICKQETLQWQIVDWIKVADYVINAKVYHESLLNDENIVDEIERDELVHEIEQVLDTVEIDDVIHEAIHEKMVETESQSDIIELDDDEHSEHEHDELVEIEVIVDEIDETDSSVEMVEISFELRIDDDEMVEYELWDDEMRDDEDEVVIIQKCEIDETQSQMYIDYIWMQEISGIIASMQDDEIDEMVENIFDIELNDDTHQVDDVDEIEQIDDRWWLVIQQCTNNDVLMWADDLDDYDEE